MHSPRARLVALTAQNIIYVFPEKHRRERQEPLTALTHTPANRDSVRKDIFCIICIYMRDILMQSTGCWEGSTNSLSALSPLRLWEWLHPWLLHTTSVRKSNHTFSKQTNFTLSDNWELVSRSKSKYKSWFQVASCHFQAHRTFLDIWTNIAKNDNHNDCITVTRLFCIHIFIVSAGSNTLKNWFRNALKWYWVNFLILLGEGEVQQGTCFIYIVAWPDI